MAISATVAVVAGTVYVADKIGDAAEAQRDAANRATANAQTQAKSIEDQTAVLREQLQQTQTQLQQQAQSTQSLLTQQQSQFDMGLQAQQQQFGTLMTQQQTNYEQQAAQQREQATAQAQFAEQEKNRLNQKKPASEQFITKNERQGMTGQASTLLTGAQGITTASLPLGKTTLLGG